MPTDPGPRSTTARNDLLVRACCVLAGIACVAGALACREFLPRGTLLWQHGALVLCCWNAFVCVRFVSPRMSVPKAAAWMLGISLAIELAQLTPGPAWLSSKHPLFRMVFGAVFSVWDVVGSIVAYALLMLGWRLIHAMRTPVVAISRV